MNHIEAIWAVDVYMQVIGRYQHHSVTNASSVKYLGSLAHGLREATLHGTFMAYHSLPKRQIPRTCQDLHWFLDLALAVELMSEISLLCAGSGSWVRGEHW